MFLNYVKDIRYVADTSIEVNKLTSQPVATLKGDRLIVNDTNTL